MQPLAGGVWGLSGIDNAAVDGGDRSDGDPDATARSVFPGLAELGLDAGQPTVAAAGLRDLRSWALAADAVSLSLLIRAWATTALAESGVVVDPDAGVGVCTGDKASHDGRRGRRNGHGLDGAAVTATAAPGAAAAAVASVRTALHVARGRHVLVGQRAYTAAMQATAAADGGSLRRVLCLYASAEAAAAAGGGDAGALVAAVDALRAAAAAAPSVEVVKVAIVAARVAGVRWAVALMGAEWRRWRRC